MLGIERTPFASQKKQNTLGSKPPSIENFPFDRATTRNIDENNKHEYIKNTKTRFVCGLHTFV